MNTSGVTQPSSHSSYERLWNDVNQLGLIGIALATEHYLNEVEIQVIGLLRSLVSV